MSGASLPAGWAQTTLGDVIEVLDSEREPINNTERQERIAGKPTNALFRYFGATGQVGWIDGFRSEGERVLLGEDGAPFLDPARPKAYLVSGRYWVNNHAHVLRGIPGVVGNAFLCHQLNVADYHDAVTGSTRLKLTSAAMKRMPFVLPPPSEQRRIVEKLDELLPELESGVSELKTAQAKLQRYRQSLLKAAVQGDLTADWRAANPPTETGTALLQRILAERRVRWEAAQRAKAEASGKPLPKGWQAKYPEPVAADTASLPELPASWTWTTLDALTADGPQNGLYLPKSRYGQGTAILRIDDYQIGWHRPREALQLVQAEVELQQLYGLCAGDLLINRVNSMTHLGKCLMVTADLAGALFESNMMRLALAPSVSVAFVARYLGSDVGRERLVATAKWAVNQASINQQDVRSTPVPLPPLAEQTRIAELLGEQLAAAQDQAAAIDFALASCTAQRQNILRAAFAGQLVPQDPSDEPAEALLARIRGTRSASVTGATRTPSRPRDPAGQQRPRRRVMST